MSELVWEEETVLPRWEILVALSALLSPVLKDVFEFWSWRRTSHGQGHAFGFTAGFQNQHSQYLSMFKPEGVQSGEGQRLSGRVFISG